MLCLGNVTTSLINFPFDSNSGMCLNSFLSSAKNPLLLQAHLGKFALSCIRMVDIIQALDYDYPGFESELYCLCNLDQIT